VSEQGISQSGKRLTFLELFKVYEKVEIPMIQRDYAQGRKSAVEIRNSFLDQIFDTLSQSKSDFHLPLDLDFVYGGLGGDKSIFQPLDGQQRLTTLFLLHWYIACQDSCRPDFSERMTDGEGKCRFVYSIRPSSGRFFSNLLKHDPAFVDGRKLSRAKMDTTIHSEWGITAWGIIEQPWFFLSWEMDPTVQSALCMLDAIHEKFSASPGIYKNCYEKLTEENSPFITMQVLDLGKFDLSDDLYIKMNARGKELTTFEKFKAWLTDHGKIQTWSASDLVGIEKTARTWKQELDGRWLDLFWDLRRKDGDEAKSVDAAFLRTIEAIAINYHLLGNQGTPISWLRDLDQKAGLSRGDWSELFPVTELPKMFDILYALSRVHDGIHNAVHKIREILNRETIGDFLHHDLWEPFFEGTGNPSLADRIGFHALCVFLTHEETLDERRAIDWFRLIRNLIRNSRFTPENLPNAIRSISSLAMSCLGRHMAHPRSVLVRFEEEMDPDVSGMKGFNREQLKEESQKAALILQLGDGSGWEMVIREAENCPVFEGQIGFLLSEKPDLTHFRKRSAVVKVLLDEEGSKIGREEYLLARAALSQCEVIRLGSQESLEFKDSAGHWKYLLGSEALEKPKGKFREGMRKLIDQLIDCPDHYSAMRKCCNAGAKDGDWMDDVILFGGAFFKEQELSQEKKVQNYQDNGTFIYNNKTYSSDVDIMLGEQARWRNRVIALTMSDPSWLLDERRIPNVHVGTPFYRGHQFHLSHKTMSWRVNINYFSVVLQKKKDSSHDGHADGWEKVLEFELSMSIDPEKVACRIAEAMKPLNGISLRDPDSE
jgi:hypothetical protein